MPLQKIDIGLSNLPVSHRDNGKTLLEPAEKAYLEQSSVTVESCRGDQLLYWTIRVKSPEFNPQKDQTRLADLWKYDSIRFGFGTLLNGKLSGRTLQDDDFEYAAGKVAGKAIVFRRKRSRAIHNSLIKETSIAKEVKFKIEAPPGEQICRFAFPRTAIRPLELRSGGTMRNNVRVKFRRNDKRIGYLQITQETGEMK